MRPLRLVLVLFTSVAFAQTANPSPGPAAHPSVQKIERVDINTATSAQLRALPGMGDAYVKRIVDGRPYTAKSQLVSRGILPKPAYEAIKDQIVAHRLKP